MYTADDYLYGWIFYLVGVTVMLICGWIITARIKYRDARIVLRLVAIVFFLVPWYTAPELDYLAPAWLIAGFEWVFEGSDAFWRAGGPLVTAITLVLAIALVVRLALYYSFKKSTSAHSTSE